MVASPTLSRRSSVPAPRFFDPEAEADPLVREHIVLLPSEPGKQTGPYVYGVSGHGYPVWSVFLIFRITGDVQRTIEDYGGDLTADQIEAVRRYARRYPDEVLPYVKSALSGA